MCGFAGFTGYLENGKEVLTRMMDRIAHRGPDSAGQYIDDKAYLGFRRLSIIDLDNGSQPMFNENKKIVITFNGEIYNHMELRQELIAKGHVFANNSDTEVLIHAYEEYGEETADEEYKAAMKILEKYRKYFPQDEELLGIYNDLKKSLGSDVVAKPVPSLEVMSVELGVLFPALMNVYACEPSGVLKVKNNSKETIKNVELSPSGRKQNF